VLDPFETPERLALAESVARFTRARIVPDLQEWEDAGEIPRRLHGAAASAGLLGVGYPEESGGQGGGPVDQLVVTQV